MAVLHKPVTNTDGALSVTALDSYTSILIFSPRFHLFMQNENYRVITRWQFTSISFFRCFSYCQWQSSMGQGSYRIQVKTIQFASRQRHKWLGYLVHCIGHQNGQLSSYINYQRNAFVITRQFSNISSGPSSFIVNIDNFLCYS